MKFPGLYKPKYMGNTRSVIMYVPVRMATPKHWFVDPFSGIYMFNDVNPFVHLLLVSY